MIADAFDRMKFGYYGKKAENNGEIIRELEQWSGRQFDPRLVKAFAEWVKAPSKHTKDHLPLFS